MAHRRRRRHRRSRRYGDLVSMPSLGGITEYNPLGKTVRSTDVAVGAAIGMLGGMGVKWLLAKLNASLAKVDAAGNLVGGLPAPILNYLGPISTVGAGALAYMFQRKKNRLRGTGHFVGAVLAGVVPAGWQMVRAQFPDLADYVTMELSGLGYAGLLVDSPQISGVIVDNPTNLAALEASAHYAMAQEE